MDHGNKRIFLNRKHVQLVGHGVIQRAYAEINLPFQQLRHQRIVGLIVKLDLQARKRLRQRLGKLRE